MTEKPAARTCGSFLLAAVLALRASPLAAERPEVAARISGLTTRSGGRATVVVELTLGERWHVNSHTPSEEYLIPTSVTLATPGGAALAVRYPKGELRRFAFAESPLSVYAGKVLFEADLTLPPGRSGPLALAGEVAYQACTDEQCFPPARIPLSAKVEVR